MDRNEKFLFNFEKEAAFTRLVETILTEDAYLILNGDIFDFTGMTPCQNGKEEFFDQAVRPEKINHELIKKVSKFRSTSELLTDINHVFPHFFNGLSKLAKKNRLIYIPGNHDCDFLKSSAQKDLSDLLNVPQGQILWSRQYRIGENVYVTHGNQYDAPNATENSCLNSGMVFTSALYMAVLPALQMLGAHPDIVAAIPAVRPEENVIKDLQHFLSKEELEKILLGLTRLLARNHYFRGLSTVPGWLLKHDVPLLSRFIRKNVTPERLQALLPKDEKLIQNARVGAQKLLKQLVRKGEATKNTTIVLGHTHELDRVPNYINLGTWVDHLRGMDADELASPQISLPVLRCSGKDELSLLEFRDLRGHSEFKNCPALQI